MRHLRLMMINSKLKSIIYSRKIRKALNNKVSSDRSFSGKVGLIIDAENFEKTKRLFELYKDLGIDKKDLSIVVCGSKDEFPENSDFKILDLKEITVSGEFKSETIRGFARDRYDFLICHFSEKSQAGSLLAAVTNAGIKVGNHPDEYGIYDVEVFSNSLEDFQQEVIKYYRILK
ncbi:hypothetical protein C8P64_2289 [Christiangramia gaetbulicola]|uniref:Uncharacterized protein n=1 Tax=Christiangramia gaetbulicola TaxID=703340 RepID=A0A2T6AJ20_9FLAO|nr:hypothetical protein [Christiangramia gaetbulicola]PTX43756.1 hypothetical protein C8P64_2289 [Christiangramia gaetbulicola]